MKSWKQLKVINYKFSFITFFCFIAFTVIGTLSHEYGHILVAKYFGYDTVLHYGSMNYENGPMYNELLMIHSKYKNEIENDLDFPEKAKWNELRIAYRNKRLQDGEFVTFGGPIQTMGVGCIGLLILFFRRKKRELNFTLLDWTAVYLSLFWLREIFNLTHSIVAALGFITTCNFNLIKMPVYRGNEGQISYIFNLPNMTIPLILGILGFAVGYYVVFYIVPKRYRLNFFFSGIIGGLAGFVIWLGLLGPKLMP